MPLDEEDKRWIDDRLQAMETRLLTAFHPVEIKARSHSAALRALDMQLEALEERLSKLESVALMKAVEARWGNK
jgi:hypothetical protein